MTFDELLLVVVDVRILRQEEGSPVMLWAVLPRRLWRVAAAREVFVVGPTAAAAQERACKEVEQLLAKSP